MSVSHHMSLMGMQICPGFLLKFLQWQNCIGIMTSWYFMYKGYGKIIEEQWKHIVIRRPSLSYKVGGNLLRGIKPDFCTCPVLLSIHLSVQLHAGSLRPSLVIFLPAWVKTPLLPLAMVLVLRFRSNLANPSWNKHLRILLSLKHSRLKMNYLADSCQETRKG